MKLRSVLALVAGAALALSGLTAPAVAGDDDVRIISGEVPDDVFVAGDRVDINADVQGDVFAAGGTINASGRVADAFVAAGGRLSLGSAIEGDAIIAGGDITLSGSVGDNLVAAGGNVVISGPVAGRAIVAGGSILFDGSATAGQDAWFAGGEITVRGDVGGNLRIMGGEVTVLGQVAGNVDIRADEVRIGPEARIAGTLTVRGEDEPMIDPAAQIAGDVRFVPKESAAEWGLLALGLGVALVLLPFIFALVVGIIAILVARPYVSNMGDRIMGQPLGSLGLGVLVLFATPPILFFLVMTIIGIPFAVIGFAFYLIVLALGLPLAALAVVTHWLDNNQRAERASRGKILLLYVAALIALAVICFIPVIGWLAIWLLLAIGIGAGLLALGGRRRHTADLPPAESTTGDA